MPIEYTLADAEQFAISTEVYDLEEFNPLRRTELDYKLVFKSKLGQNDEPAACGNPCDLKKVPEVFMSLSPTVPDYVLVVDRFWWDNHSEDQCRALLHSTFMRLTLQESRTGIKVVTRRPDLVTFIRTVERYGAWMEPLNAVGTALQVAATRLAQVVRPSRTGTSSP